MGVHVPPAVQETHAPALHTRFVPQTVPLTRFAPLSAQVMAGEQAMTPAWQGLVGVQVIPTVHAAQAPALHTRLGPQLVPF